MILTRRIGVGAIADVFETAEPLQVCKLIKQRPLEAWPQVAAQLARAEAIAYEIASKDARLSAHVPRCFGACVVSQVLSEIGEDVSGHYVLASGLRLERLNIECEEKAAYLDADRFPWVHELLEAFDESGINAYDASAINYTTIGGLRFLDLLTDGDSDSFAAYSSRNRRIDV